MEPANATRTFLGDESRWSTASIELYDIQALWGGLRLYVAGPGRVIAQRVLPGKVERRYEFELGAGEWKRLLDLFIENDFLTIKPLERPGIPDEARPSITLVNARGDKRLVAKWAGVNDERFDSLYSALTRLETFTTQLEPVYNGPYQSGI